MTSLPDNFSTSNQKTDRDVPVRRAENPGRPGRNDGGSSDARPQPGSALASAPSFTRGPWHCAGGNYIGIIATVNGGPAQIGRAESFGHISDSEVEANAALIAAAPELLAALKALLPHGWDDGSMDHMPGVAQARAAIAKAEGRTP